LEPCQREKTTEIAEETEENAKSAKNLSRFRAQREGTSTMTDEARRRIKKARNEGATSLNLSGQSLTNTDLSELEGLTHLSQLNIGNNQIIDISVL
jgi:Leucine-rich repeat (LRR) protein